MRRHRPDFTAVHLIDLDSARHHHGTFSKETMAALGRNDRRLEEIRRAMQETPGMEDALLIADRCLGHLWRLPSDELSVLYIQ